ncbi:MAG: hypothetical protein ACYDDU_21890 [Dermatophilaceae bacterium]
MDEPALRHLLDRLAAREINPGDVIEQLRRVSGDGGGHRQRGHGAAHAAARIVGVRDPDATAVASDHGWQGLTADTLPVAPVGESTQAT